MRYSMESALKLFLFVSLVTFSTVTLGHVHSMGLELKVMWFHRSGPLTKREDGRYIPQIQFAKTLGEFPLRSKDWCFHGKIVGLGARLGTIPCILVSPDWVGDTLGFWNPMCHPFGQSRR